MRHCRHLLLLLPSRRGCKPLAVPQLRLQDAARGGATAIYQPLARDDTGVGTGDSACRPRAQSRDRGRVGAGPAKAGHSKKRGPESLRPQARGNVPRYACRAGRVPRWACVSQSAHGETAAGRACETPTLHWPRQHCSGARRGRGVCETPISIPYLQHATTPDAAGAPLGAAAARACETL